MKRHLFSSAIAVCLFAPINAKALNIDLQLGTLNNGNFLPFPGGAEILAPGFFGVVVGLSAQELNPQNVPVATNIGGIQYDIAYTNELNANFAPPFNVANFVQPNVQFGGCVNAFLFTVPGNPEPGRKCTVRAQFVVGPLNPFAQPTKINQFFPLFGLTLWGGNNAVRDGKADLFIDGGNRAVLLPVPPPPGAMINNDNFVPLPSSNNSNGIDLVPVPGPVPSLGVIAFLRFSRMIRR
jgi:hypothetical protein